MKVLQVATGFPINFPGGITNYVRSLTDHLIRQGCQVDVLSGSGGQSWGTAEVHLFQGVNSVFSLSVLRDDPAQARWLHALFGQYDVVHFHMNYGFPASVYDQEIEVPYLVSLHDYGYICPRIFMTDKWGQVCESRVLDKCARCVGWLEQSDILRVGARKLGWRLPTVGSAAVQTRANRLNGFLARAAGRLAVSSKVAEIFEAAVPGAPCSVVHIGNDSAGPIPPRSVWAASGKIRCAYIGTLNRDKGAEVFIELVKRVSHEKFEFEFWGRGEPAYVEQLARLGVGIRGAYTPDRLRDILAQVDLGMVLPVWNDNGPQVLMEFLNHGVPVLGTDRGGVPDFLRRACGHVFDPVSGMDEAVAWLARLDTVQLQAMHENIVPLKTPSQHAQEVLGLYQAAQACAA